MRLHRIVASVVVLCWPSLAAAANTTSPTSPSLFPLVLVGVFALVATSWLRRRQTPACAEIEVLSRVSLEPRRSVVVVRLCDRGLVLGSSEAGLHPIAELSAEELASFTAPNVSRETSEAE